MPNKNYLRGVRRERMLVNEAKEKGLISARTAGSHGAYDLYILDEDKAEIRLIQVKTHKIEKPKPLKLPLIVRESKMVTLTKEFHHYYTR